MADENQGKNGDAVSTRAPRRSAAGNKAWQSLMPHKQAAAAAAAAAAEHMEEEEEEEEEEMVTPPPPPVVARGRGRPPANSTPAAAPAILQRKPVVGAPVTPTATKTAAAAAAPPPQLPQQQQQQRGMSDDEELEEASSELFPKPPPEQKRPPKRKGRPPKNGFAAMSESGSVSGSHTSGGKKVKLEDSADDFDLDEEEEDEDGYGGPPMLNRQISRTPSYNRRACSPTCTKRCCLTEDGKRVSRQTATGVRNDQYDPPYNARPSGKRKPRTPKMPSETPSSEKRGRAPYGSKKAEKEQMMMKMAGGGGAQFGSSAPGARSMTAVSAGRPLSTMPQRAPILGGGLAPGSRVVTVGPGGKVQQLTRPNMTSPPNMTLVSRQRIGGGGGMMATAGGGPTRYPVAIAQHQQARLPGPNELLRAENTVEEQYKQARAAFSKQVVAGSSATEFNRVIDLLSVENKRLIAAQSDEQEYVDGLHRKIRALENNVASLQRQLSVTTKAYHGALLEVNAERGGGGGIGMSAVAPPPGIRVTVGGPGGGMTMMRAGGAQLQHQQQPAAQHTMQQQQPKMEKNEDIKPKKEEEGDEDDEEKEAGEARAPGAPSGAVPAGVPTAAAAAAAGRSVPRLMEQQQEGRGAAAAQMMLNRQDWMQGFDEDDEDMYDDIMEEVIEEEEMGYFDDEEGDEERDGMGLD